LWDFRCQSVMYVFVQRLCGRKNPHNFVQYMQLFFEFPWRNFFWKVNLVGAESAHIPVRGCESEGGADKIERAGISPCTEMSLLLDYTSTLTESGKCYHVYQPGRKSHEMLHDAILRIRVACQCNWRGRAPGEAYALAIPRRHSTAYPATGPHGPPQPQTE
jgi:hypothetical protein